MFPLPKTVPGSECILFPVDAYRFVYKQIHLNRTSNSISRLPQPPPANDEDDDDDV